MGPMEYTRIENAARGLHERIWRARKTLWAQPMPAPAAMLDPAVAARLLDIEFEIHDELGSRFPSGDARFEIAGLIDRQARKIAISRRFPLPTRRFTAAHWLCPANPGFLLEADMNTLEREVAVASTRSYAGRHFDSLAKYFGVTIASMAIRLKELQLVQA